MSYNPYQYREGQRHIGDTLVQHIGPDTYFVYMNGGVIDVDTSNGHYTTSSTHLARYTQKAFDAVAEYIEGK